MARKNIEALEKLKAEVIVTECGSCSSFLKEYPELFEDDQVMKSRAEAISKKVRAFSEFMVTLVGALSAGSLSGKKVTYHDPCHMSRYQGVVKEPRELIRKISGLTYAEMPEADRCCGAAGSYNIMHYEQSMKVLEKKMENLKKTGADILTTECPGCVIQLSYGVRQAGLPTRVLHISELIKEASRQG
jgi:glycolate oxidase iron-sulfur subunit